MVIIRAFYLMGRHAWRPYRGDAMPGVCTDQLIGLYDSFSVDLVFVFNDDVVEAGLQFCDVYFGDAICAYSLFFDELAGHVKQLQLCIVYLCVAHTHFPVEKLV